MRKVSLPLVATIAVAILFVSAIAGIVVYYNGMLNDRNQKIALLNQQIAVANSQISNLTIEVSNLRDEITNLTTANLETELGIAEVGNTSSVTRAYNRLYIQGSVTNIGPGVAMNAGLHIVAYSADRTLQINMTVPLTYGEFGANKEIYSYIYSFDPYATSSPKYGNLASGQTAGVNLNIYHEGTVTNWTVTPAWKNTS
jgi:hypothetical protein